MIRRTGRDGGRRRCVVFGEGLVAVSVWVIGTVGCQPHPPEPELWRLASQGLMRGLEYEALPAVRAQATEAVADVFGRDKAMLIRERLRDEHPGVRFAACMALGKLKDTQSVRELRAILRDSDASVQAGAYFALERLGIRSHREAWANLLLKHEDASVRGNAALAMGRLEDPSVVALLEQASRQDAEDRVRQQALEGLALLGDEKAIGRFTRDAYGGVGDRQLFAVMTLAEIESDEALAVLRSRLDSSPYLEVQLAAARGLGRRGYDVGVRLALSSLTWDKPNPDLMNDPPANQIRRVRTLAALALGEIGDSQALGPLKQLMATDPDPRVQLAAATAALMILRDTREEPVQMRATASALSASDRRAGRDAASELQAAGR